LANDRAGLSVDHLGNLPASSSVAKAIGVNRVFEAYDDIIDAACEAWNKLTVQPALITSIGMRDRAHVSHN